MPTLAIGYFVDEAPSSPAKPARRPGPPAVPGRQRQCTNPPGPGLEFLGKLAPGAGTGRPAALSNLFPAGPRAVDPRPARRAIARNALRATAGRPRARHTQWPTGWRRDAHRPRSAPSGQAAQLRPGTAGGKGPSPGHGPISTGAGGAPSQCWRWPARYPRRAATSSWWSMPAMAARTPARSVARASAKGRGAGHRPPAGAADRP